MGIFINRKKQQLSTDEIKQHQKVNTKLLNAQIQKMTSSDFDVFNAENNTSLNNINKPDIKSKPSIDGYDINAERKNSWIGRNSHLVYTNKYVSTGRRLATTEVVDISEFGSANKLDNKSANQLDNKNEDDFIDDNDDSEDLLNFDDFFKNLTSDEPKEELEEEVEKNKKEEILKPEPAKVVAKPKPATTMAVKKKKMVDIDISGTGGHFGGDII